MLSAQRALRQRYSSWWVSTPQKNRNGCVVRVSSTGGVGGGAGASANNVIGQPAASETAIAVNATAVRLVRLELVRLD